MATTTVKREGTWADRFQALDEHGGLQASISATSSTEAVELKLRIRRDGSAQTYDGFSVRREDLYALRDLITQAADDLEREKKWPTTKFPDPGRPAPSYREGPP